MCKLKSDCLSCYHMSHSVCPISYVIYAYVDPWDMLNSEQLLFSCVSSKVSICNYVTCRMSHVTCHMSNAYVDRWDMLINFCFHVYAQKSLFIAENCNGLFWTSSSSSSPYPVSLEFIELVPS